MNPINANTALAKLKKYVPDAFIYPIVDSNTLYYRVQIGAFTDTANATKLQHGMLANGITTFIEKRRITNVK